MEFLKCLILKVQSMISNTRSVVVINQRYIRWYGIALSVNNI